MSQFIRFAAGVITGVVAIKLIKGKKTEAETEVATEPAAEKKTAPRSPPSKTAAKHKKVDGGEEQTS
jgi:hypothetical protein